MNIVSFDFNQSGNKRKTTFKGSNIREDVRSNAFRFANDHIQNGVLSVLSSTKDNHILCMIVLDTTLIIMLYHHSITDGEDKSIEHVLQRAACMVRPILSHLEIS